MILHIGEEVKKVNQKKGAAQPVACQVISSIGERPPPLHIRGFNSGSNGGTQTFDNLVVAFSLGFFQSDWPSLANDTHTVQEMRHVSP